MSVRDSASRALLACTLVAAAWIAACGKTKPQPPFDPPSDGAAAGTSSVVRWEAHARETAIAEGKATLEKHQCTRCHTIDTIAAGARPLHCTGCHIFLKGLKPHDKTYQDLVAKYGEPILARYQRNITHLQQVPNLTLIARRVRPDWIGEFLTEPFDVRPLLTESMIRHHLAADEIKSVVRYFAAMADAEDPYGAAFHAPALPEKPAAQRIAAGQKLYVDKGCNACHTYGNLQTSVTKEMLETAKPASLLAPNLRFVRVRTRPEIIVDWILEPQKISPGTPMPASTMSRDEAETLRDFLLFGDPLLSPPPPAPAMVLPKPVTRDVSYEEMKKRVLSKVCMHYHMNDYEKDKGPGNRGGLGYEGVQFAMRTYERLVHGALDKATGARYSVLVARAGESMPPILQAMLRRRVEGARDQVPPFGDYERPHYSNDAPGMPMGLPAMTDEEIGLLSRWIDEGCPGPSKVSGVKGVNDGYLTPDGPIEKNKGCELREPSKVRPAWAIESEKPAANTPSESPKSAPAASSHAHD